jgi:mRNA interferase RelE/StbE
MRRWQIEFHSEAKKDLSKIDPPTRGRIIAKLEWLLEHFEEILPEVLAAEFKNFYKLRMGDWRIIYKINWPAQIIIVCFINRRDKIYKCKD